MGRLKESIDRLTFGNPRRCVRFVLWRFLDSLVTSVPSVVMVVATWLLVQPIVHPGAALDFVALWACVAVLAAQVLASYATSHKVYVLSCAGTADAVLDARLAMGEKLRRLPLGFYQRHDAGDIDSVLLRDYETVENYGAEVLSQAGMIAAKTTLSAVVLAFFDWRLALATFAVVPCALPFLWKGFNAMAQSSGRLTKASQECSSRTIEYVAGIRTLKAFNLAGTRFGSLRASFEELRKASLGKEEASRPVGVFGRALLLAGAGVVMLAGCALLQAQAVHPFVLLMFLLLALGIYEPIVTLFYFLSDFGNADAAGKRIERLLAEPELPEPPAEAPAAPHGHGIAFDDVSFSYGGDERALEHVSLTIPEGGLTALVGPSGSGKSTVAKLAARFWDPQAGTVTLGGADLARRAADDVLAGTSVVFQDVYLFHDTVAENIRMGRADATDEDVREAARLAACLDFIEALPDGFDTVVGEGGCTLSGGEKQRISIARALLKDAPVVLLDEATSSLDPANEVAVQQAIAELVKRKTVMAIAHRLQSVRDADNIVVLDSGRVESQGTHDELLARSPLYAALWAEQQRANGWKIKPEASPRP